MGGAEQERREAVMRVLAGESPSRVAADLGRTDRGSASGWRATTPQAGHVKALLALDPDEPQAMGTLAQNFACDASTMTWLVDRLEEKGLVERRGLKNDRRVKTVALTPEGVKTKEELESRMYEPPEFILDLDRDVLESLHEVLGSLVTAAKQ